MTYYYPPQPGSGSNRWLAMVKYLRRIGHEVTVVTAAPPGHDPGVADGVVRTSNLNRSRLLRSVLLRPDRTTATPSATALPNRVAPPWVWKGIVPDPWLVTWNPYAWRAVQREISRRPVDCVITSSPAESTHLLGLAPSRSRPAWIADFRDGWTFEPLRERFPLSVQRRLDRTLERHVGSRADVLVGVTAPIAEDLAVRFGTPTVHVPNGFDPEVAIDAELASELGIGMTTMVHTGPLLGPRGRDPRPLLVALRRLLDERPDLTGRLQLLVAGRSEYDERGLLDDTGLGQVVRHLGYLPREQALGLQRAADALVLLTSDARCEATGKLYEYLASGRPIIALADANEAARIVGETHTGIVVPPHDVEAITAALKAALTGELERCYAPRSLGPYTYPAPAIQMAEAVETAIARRAGQPDEPSDR